MSRHGFQCAWDASQEKSKPIPCTPTRLVNAFGELRTALKAHEEGISSPDRAEAALNLTIQFRRLTVMPPHVSLEPFEEKRLEQPQKQILPGRMLSREAQELRRQDPVPDRDYDVALMAKK